jgi:hypothetical protein
MEINLLTPRHYLLTEKINILNTAQNVISNYKYITTMLKLKLYNVEKTNLNINFNNEFNFPKENLFQLNSFQL